MSFAAMQPRPSRCRWSLVVGPAFLALALVQAARGQSSPAQGPLPTVAAPATSAEPPLADYLALLQQISPAAERGARTYLAATQLRCGRRLDTAALRSAMASDGGDPVLMGLIRAAATHDRAARLQLVTQIPCAREVRP